MTHKTLFRPAVNIALIGGVALSSLALSACSGIGGLTGSNDSATASCPSGPMATLVALDNSGSQQGPGLESMRQTVISDAVQLAAVCAAKTGTGGNLRVSAFAASSTDTAVIYDGTLMAKGATSNARLRKAPKLADQAIKQIDMELVGSAGQVSGDGSDITGQLNAAADYMSQLNTGKSGKNTATLRLVVLTDGVQNVKPDLTDVTLTVERAEELAEAVSVPDLSGTDITFAGLGKDADPAVIPTSYAEALKAFYSTVCEKTGAAKCHVVTDYQPVAGSSSKGSK